MSDKELRESHRRFTATNSTADEATYLRARIRCEDIDSCKVRIASRCGHAGAGLIYAEDVVKTWTTSISDDQELHTRVSLAACRAILPSWNYRQRSHAPIVWFENLGGKTRYWMDDERRSMCVRFSYKGYEWESLVPMEQMRKAYPGFHTSTHWEALLNAFRQYLYERNIHLPIDDVAWRAIPFMDAALKEDQPNILIKTFAEESLYSLSEQGYYDIPWLVSLLRVPWHHQWKEMFEYCMEDCYLWMEETVLTKAINEEIITWALR